MRPYLFRLRLPLAIFIILVLASFAAGYALINYTITINTSRIRGDYFYLKTQSLEVDFPKDWYAAKWDDVNQSGAIYITLFSPYNLPVVVFFRIFNEEATATFLSENLLTDAFSVVVFEVNRIYEWCRINNNPDATLSFIENVTVSVSNYEANYSKIIIYKGFKQDVIIGNISGIFIAQLRQQKLVQIAFYGREEEWNQPSVQEAFKIILNSTKL